MEWLSWMSKALLPSKSEWEQQGVITDHINQLCFSLITFLLLSSYVIHMAKERGRELNMSVQKQNKMFLEINPRTSRSAHGVREIHRNHLELSSWGSTCKDQSQLDTIGLEVLGTVLNCKVFNRILSFKHYFFLLFLPQLHTHTHTHTYLLAKVYENTRVLGWMSWEDSEPRSSLHPSVPKLLSHVPQREVRVLWLISEISASGFAEWSCSPPSGVLSSVLHHFLLVTFFLLRGSGCFLLASSLPPPTPMCLSLWGLLSPQQLWRGTDTHGVLPCCSLNFPFKPYVHPTQNFLFSPPPFFFSCYPSAGKDKVPVMKTMNKVIKTHNKLMD